MISQESVLRVHQIDKYYRKGCLKCGESTDIQVAHCTSLLSNQYQDAGEHQRSSANCLWQYVELSSKVYYRKYNPVTNTRHEMRMANETRRGIEADT